MQALDYLEKIRQRPTGQRYTIALASTILIVLIIIVLWLTISFFKFQDKEYNEKVFSFGPFSLIKEMITGVHEEAVEEK